MDGILANLVLAARDEPDVQMWYIIVVGILTAIGALWKKWQEHQQRDKMGQSPPKARSPEVPGRPPRADEATTIEGLPPRRPEPLPRVRPTSAAPLPARKPPVARPASISERAPLDTTVDVTVGTGSRPAWQTAPQKPGTAPTGVLSPPAPGVLQANLNQMLRDPTGLQSAFVLSEILAPPLALRDA